MKHISEHESDGWILSEEIVINSRLENDGFRALFKCNHLGCEETKEFKFDIINVEEAKK
jgi:hypothetical protein